MTVKRGALFAAWDSVRGDNQDLYGAWCIGGKWRKERRITRSPYMENHAALAAHDGEMAYVANGLDDSVTVIDVNRLEAVDRVAADEEAGEAACS